MSRNNITFKKLILLFTVVIVPLLLLSVYLLYQNNTANKKRIFSSIETKTNSTAEIITTSLEQIYNTASEVAGQSNLRKITFPPYPMSVYERTKNASAAAGAADKHCQCKSIH